MLNIQLYAYDTAITMLAVAKFARGRPNGAWGKATWGLTARWRPGVALLDYRKLCPKSGHALSEEEREQLRARAGTAGRAGKVRCAACGRTVTTQPDPGTRRFLVYPMHVRHEN